MQFRDQKYESLKNNAMKKNLIFILLLFCIINSIAQTIENPAFERSDVPAFHITKVEITKDTTYVICLYYGEAGAWASISKDTYLRDSKSHKTFSLQRCEGLPYSPEVREFYQNESCEIIFCFPSIAGAEQFDFIESEGERGFNIYGINLKKQYKTSYTDEELERISELLSTYKSSSDIEKTMILKDYISSLYNLESYYVSKGNYAEAIRLGKLDIKIREVVFGKENLNYIESLDNLINYYTVLGKYDEAILLGMENVEIIKKVYGTDDPKYVNLLENLASFYNELGDYDEAIRFSTEAMNIHKRVRGIEDPNYTNSLCNLAFYYFKNGNCKESVRLETEAMEIIKKVVGTEHLNYATSLSRLADYNLELLNYEEVIKLGTEAMEICKRVLGTEHPFYAASLSKLADYNSKAGNYSEAVRIGNEAKEIEKRVIGTENAKYATLLNNLAGYYQDLGYYSETIRLMTEAKEIYEKVFGKESLDYAITLNNFAAYYLEVGNYSEAIRLGIEAMELYKKVIGTEHPLYALSLSNLANYNSRVGNYSEAIRLVTEAMEIYKRVLGTEHPNYAAALNILAINNCEVGNYSEAMRYATEAMEICKKIHGTEHPEYARLINGLGVYNLQVGNYSEAIRLGTEAMEIRKRILGIEHPLYASSLLNLTLYNYVLGNYDESITLGTEAKEIFKKIFGIEHPNYSTTLNLLARYYLKIGNYYEAFTCLQHRLINDQSFVLKNFTEFSSHIQENMWTNKYAYTFNTLLPCIATKYQTNHSVSELYDKTCLFAKGILLNTGIEIRKLILESGDSVMIDKYNTLSSNISLYNKLLEKPVKERPMDADSLNRVIERQEMALARESKVYGDYTHNLIISWKDIQRELGDNDIAIEFLDFPIIETDSILYVALTLKKDYDSPHMVTLFEKNQLKIIPEDIYYVQSDVSDLIWKPLEEELNGVRTIYFAPSGELHRIGIEYLPISETENISDVYTLHRLSSTRQLVVIQNEIKGKNTILYGGINYDEKSKTISADSTSTKGGVLRSALLYRGNVDSLSLRNSYDYLEGTKREADLIAEDMKQHSVSYKYYSGTDATEESFKNLDGTRPMVMHIATHGFYYTEAEAEKTQFASPVIELLTEGGQNVGKVVENKSMTRSGLLFSGCNNAIRHEQISEGEENGILTAQEISTLDLRGLDLVVLSACQTGLGDIISGEGVFGLQRGFKKAGAKTIIMSLWNVNDESTMKMMTSFYHHYLEGMSKEKAFHAAQDELRKNSPAHQERPDWAAFILLDGLN